MEDKQVQSPAVDRKTEAGPAAGAAGTPAAATWDFQPLLQVREMHLDYLSRSDFKAAFLLVCYVVLIALLVLEMALTRPKMVPISYHLLAAANIAIILVGIGLLVDTIMPRMARMREKRFWRYFVRVVEGQDMKTPTYFLGILDFSREEFVKDVAKRLCEDREYVVEQYAAQIYALAQICKVKFIRVGLAAHLLYVSVLLSFLLAVLDW